MYPKSDPKARYTVHPHVHRGGTLDVINSRVLEDVPLDYIKGYL